MSDRDGDPTKDVDIAEEIYRAWKDSPTPETVSTSVSWILGECYSFWDEEEEDGLPIIRVEEQEWFEIMQNQLASNDRPDTNSGQDIDHGNNHTET